MFTLIALYAATAVLTTGALSWERGSRGRYEPKTLSDYDFEDFFAPMILGVLGPVTLFTVVPYVLGAKLKPMLAARKERLAQEQRAKDRELAAHEAEVDKYLQEGRV